MSRLAGPAAELSRYAKARLALALKLPFGTPVTGYLVSVHIIASESHRVSWRPQLLRE